MSVTPPGLGSMEGLPNVCQSRDLQPLTILFLSGHPTVNFLM